MYLTKRVTEGAVCALVWLVVGTTEAKNSVSLTASIWQKCSESNSQNRALGALPDTRVRVLALENCQLTTLQPGDFHGLPNLEELLLNVNNLSDVDTIVFKDLSTLTTLSLNKNQIKKMLNFAKNPGVLPKLDTLRIDDNEIQQLDNPEALSTLTNLHVFSANKNLIEYIHEDMFKKLPLTTIHLLQNQLRYIPETLFRIETLEALFLDNNKIGYIPKDAFQGSSITELHIQDNKLTFLQDDFLSQFPGGKLRTFRFEGNLWLCDYGRLLLTEVMKVGITDFNPDYYNGTYKPCLQSGIDDTDMIVNIEM